MAVGVLLDKMVVAQPMVTLVALVAAVVITAQEALGIPHQHLHHKEIAEVTPLGVVHIHQAVAVAQVLLVAHIVVQQQGLVVLVVQIAYLAHR